MTTPYAPSVAALVTASHEQSFTAAAYPATGAPIPLNVDGGMVQWDESSSPRVTARLTLPADLNHADLARLDPRTNVRVKMSAGYRLPSGAWDTHQIADLGLRKRTLKRPENVITLDLASDEALVIDAGEGWYRFGYFTYDVPSAATAIRWHIESALDGTPAAGPSIIDTTPAGTPITIPVPRDYWDAIVDLADSIDADVYDNGDRIFRIAPRPKAGPSAAQLATGPLGTITDSTATLDREPFANTVIVLHEWTDPTTLDQAIIPGIASLPPGHPWSANVTGHKRRVIRRDTPTDSTRAAAAATTILRRSAERARSYTLTAPAMWWLRPGQTVTVQLPTGDQERHITARIEFDLTDRSMTIETRLPDYADAIGE